VALKPSLVKLLRGKIVPARYETDRFEHADILFSARITSI
jgi:hypothetical protein